MQWSASWSPSFPLKLPVLSLLPPFLDQTAWSKIYNLTSSICHPPSPVFGNKVTWKSTSRFPFCFFHISSHDSGWRKRWGRRKSKSFPGRELPIRCFTNMNVLTEWCFQACMLNQRAIKSNFQPLRNSSEWQHNFRKSSITERADSSSRYHWKYLITVGH